MRRRILIATTALLVGGAGIAVGVRALWSPCPGSTRTCSLPVSLTVDSKWHDSGLAVRIDSAELLVSPQELRLLVRGLFTQRSTAALERLEVALRLWDARGRERERIEEIIVHTRWHPPLWQGDSKSFFISTKVGRVAERYELTAHYLKTADPPDHGAVGEIPIDLPPGTPPGLKLVAYARTRERGLDDARSIETVGAAIENQGPLPVRALSVELAAFGSGGRRLSPNYSTISTLAWEDEAPMLPGDRRVVRLHCDVRGRLETDRVLVGRLGWSATPHGPVETATLRAR